MASSRRTPKKTARAGRPKSVAQSRAVRNPTPDIGAESPARGWTFLTNHAHVLLCLAHAGSLTARELSLRIGITERSVQAILSDLVADGYLEKTKVGRRNDYAVNESGRLRHPLEAAHTVGELIEALT
ncbi:helix-turn-helix transcriptional regulator [Mycolicibacterium arenosum]|uniref:helix-turn-helix transcriptional regulator n=1 Tax=Mycolicibacterium arenosum TaxID=2952157 RepID=UPI0038CD53A1